MSKIWRKSPVVALMMVVALLFSGIAIITYSENAYHTQKAQEVSVQARILASTLTAALAFNDRNAAQEYVGALAADPEIRIAGVYDANRALFAASPRFSEHPPAILPQIETPSFNSDRLTVTVPVAQDETYLGAVYIQTLTQPFSRRLERYGIVALLVIMASMAIAVLGSSHAAITRVNVALEEQARDLAKVNEDLRHQIAERERAEGALRQAQKMEAIGQLTGGVAHDFNNLLTTIMGNAELLEYRQDKTGKDPAAARMLASIISAAEGGAALTQRLLAFSRKQTLVPKVTDINKLVAGIYEMIRRTLGESIAIETRFASGLQMTFIDAHQLENALLNLAVNARDAMSASGTLTVETKNTWLAEDEAAAVEALPGPYVMVAVGDNGTGMPPEIMRRVFEPFFTTKSEGQGSGLGLSQVYGFVRQSLGYVRLRSEEGKGTTIQIYLPRWTGEEKAPAPESSPAQAPREEMYAGAGETVLVVEDDEEVRGYTVEAVTFLGYRVLETADANSALRLLEQRSDIKVLFTDVGLPGKNGCQLAEEALRLVPGLKILFTSGYIENANLQGGLQGGLPEGDVHFLPKPFTIEQLAKELREALWRNRTAA